MVVWAHDVNAEVALLQQVIQTCDGKRQWEEDGDRLEAQLVYVDCLLYWRAVPAWGGIL